MTPKGVHVCFFFLGGGGRRGGGGLAEERWPQKVDGKGTYGKHDMIHVVNGGGHVAATVPVLDVSDGVHERLLVAEAVEID